MDKDALIGRLFCEAEEAKQKVGICLQALIWLKSGEVSLDRLEVSESGFTIAPLSNELPDNIVPLKE